MKTFLLAAGSALVVYLLFSFYAVSLDISTWTESSRAACSIFMASALALAYVASWVNEV